MADNRKSSPASWMLKRLDQVKIIQKGDNVTVVIPKDIHWALAGLLVDEALLRAGLHPNQLRGN